MKPAAAGWRAARRSPVRALVRGWPALLPALSLGMACANDYTLPALLILAMRQGAAACASRVTRVDTHFRVLATTC